MRLQKITHASLSFLYGFAFCMLFFTACTNNSKSLKHFDQKVWLENAGNETKNNPRAGMISELIDTVLKKGMSKDEVTALLGPPDSNRDQLELYDIGRSPWGIDLEYLAIDYDENSLVKAYMLRG